ncbi:hypothetical protein, partial [Pseudonocardia spinosispora]|uniref:hypothetical protein n=1 Tax=Pseudonocardia spinosispora TaxID=103441 RepID=UPI001B7FBC6E
VLQQNPGLRGESFQEIEAPKVASPTYPTTVPGPRAEKARLESLLTGCCLCLKIVTANKSVAGL